MASYYIRSLSFPSKPHPIVKQFDEQLSKLRPSESALTPSSSLPQTLSNLNDLYCSVEQLLQLPLNQKSVSQNVGSNSIDEVLDGSLRLLDLCGTSRDLLEQSKDCLQGLQSALRRGSSGEPKIITNEVVQYLNTRKGAKKLIKNALKNIRKSDQTKKEDDKNDAVKSMLKELQEITQDVFKSVLNYMDGAKFHSRKWSLISKFVQDNGSKEEAVITGVIGFEFVDASFESIISQKNKNCIDMVVLMEKVMTQMVKLETEIQDLDEALDCLFRHLVKTRSSLLNIVSN